MVHQSFLALEGLLFHLYILKKLVVVRRLTQVAKWTVKVLCFLVELPRHAEDLLSELVWAHGEDVIETEHAHLCLVHGP